VTDEALMGDPEEGDEDLLAALLGDNQADTLDSLLDALGDDDDDDDGKKVIEL
jgi:hypothetical protein